MENYPRYDLFSGFPDRDAIWIQSIDGLANAHDCMEKLAAEKPGPYFVFSISTSTVVAKIDTTDRHEVDRSLKKQAS
jgi:hypothetical protein